nr:phosphotransferase [Acidimicrobiia bacterium]
NTVRQAIPEPKIEAAAIERYLREHLWPDVEIPETYPVGRGWESEIIGFGAELPDRSLDLVLRMYTGLGGEEKAVTEGNAMRMLHATGYPVPLVHHQEPSPGPLGLPFIIMDRVEGEQLYEHLNAAQPAVRARLESELVELLVALHRIDPKPFGADIAGNDPHRFARRTLRNWRAVTELIGIDDGGLLDWLDHHIGNIATLPPAVVHNDFHAANVLRGDEGGMTVIDWTGVEVTDRRFDLAWTLMLHELYGGADSQVPAQAQYEDSLAAPDLEFFAAAARLRRLFGLVVSLTAGPEALGMREGARDRIAGELEISQPLYEQLVAISGIRWPAFESLDPA